MTSRSRLLLGLAIAALWTADASGSDGVIEINEARATAGGVTPGDTPGFPITLSQPGSYRLTGSLSPLNVSAFAITAIP